MMTPSSPVWSKMSLSEGGGLREKEDHNKYEDKCKSTNVKSVSHNQNIAVVPEYPKMFRQF